MSEIIKFRLFLLCLIATATATIAPKTADAMLDPVVGRFMQRDPAGYVDGQNLVQYERSAPTALTDSDGMRPRGRTGPRTTANKNVVCGCCVKSVSFPPSDPSTLGFQPIPNRQFKAGKVTTTYKYFIFKTFRIEAEFIEDPKNGCSASMCEYRQYVRGAFTYRGQPHHHPLNAGVSLHPTRWLEDGPPRAGHRSGPGIRNTRLDSYTGGTGRQDGTKFVYIDYPGIEGGDGDSLSADLEFLGQIIETDGKGGFKKVVKWANWEVKFQHTVKAGKATIPAVRFRPPLPRDDAPAFARAAGGGATTAAR